MGRVRRYESEVARRARNARAASARATTARFREEPSKVDLAASWRRIRAWMDERDSQR